MESLTYNCERSVNIEKVDRIDADRAAIDGADPVDYSDEESAVAVDACRCNEATT